MVFDILARIIKNEHAGKKESKAADPLVKRFHYSPLVPFAFHKSKKEKQKVKEMQKIIANFNIDSGETDIQAVDDESL